jgi:hypothetical protein
VTAGWLSNAVLRQESHWKTNHTDSGTYLAAGYMVGHVMFEALKIVLQLLKLSLTLPVQDGVKDIVHAGGFFW